MGFFSWQTSDTRESIMNIYSQGPVRTVYMLVPDYGQPYEEPAYEGYGDFGGVDAFAHLARMNHPDLTRGQDDDFARKIGCALEAGYYELVADGSKHLIFHDGGQLIDPSITYHGVRYDDPIAAFGGRGANEMIASGELVERHFQIDKPLKFSFSADADYNALPAAENCPIQGFFDGDEDD